MPKCDVVRSHRSSHRSKPAPFKLRFPKKAGPSLPASPAWSEPAAGPVSPSATGEQVAVSEPSPGAEALTFAIPGVEDVLTKAIEDAFPNYEGPFPDYEGSGGLETLEFDAFYGQFQNGWGPMLLVDEGLQVGSGSEAATFPMELPEDDGIPDMEDILRNKGERYCPSEFRHLDVETLCQKLSRAKNALQDLQEGRLRRLELEREAEKETLQCRLCRFTSRWPRVVPCGHVFCQGCLEGLWMQKDGQSAPRCPTCQAEIHQRPVPCLPMQERANALQDEEVFPDMPLNPFIWGAGAFIQDRPESLDAMSAADTNHAFNRLWDMLYPVGA
ncbi:hypothetical protein EUX98_g7745 [Antrodiella citrinella]|uniref:RING-type domain-containing protein n=1 Tax=Antrodiella citrinella TaxID=2447956 RepID=A0A4S4MLB7_9APHY|nr:hypothetical protein EUX98_g7745 [Antrodiella citrinella]